MSDDIWLVTSGEYSSYSVDAAFTTEEGADAWADASNKNRGKYKAEFCVERVDLDPPLPEVVRRVVEEDDTPEPPPKPYQPPWTVAAQRLENVDLIDSLKMEE